MRRISYTLSAAAALITFVLSGCVGIPNSQQQGGSAPSYYHSYQDSPQWGDGECSISYDNLREFAKGANVTVGAEAPCSLSFSAGEISQGDASITGETIQIRAAQLEYLIGLAARAAIEVAD